MELIQIGQRPQFPGFSRVKISQAFFNELIQSLRSLPLQVIGGHSGRLYSFIGSTTTPDSLRTFDLEMVMEDMRLL